MQSNIFATVPNANSTPSFSQKSMYLNNRTDVVVNAIGIIDQAAQTLFQLRNLQSMPTAPRSLILEIIQLQNQFKTNGRVVSQLSLLSAAGTCLVKLGREWSDVAKSKQRTADAARDPYRYYKLVSLAAASMLIPWLLIRQIK